MQEFLGSFIFTTGALRILELNSFSNKFIDIKSQYLKDYQICSTITNSVPVNRQPSKVLFMKANNLACKNKDLSPTIVQDAHTEQLILLHR